MNKMKTIQGKLALITGGSSGIGLALAKKLTYLGANVWILARRMDSLQSALQEMEKVRHDSSQRLGTISADVTQEVHIPEKIAEFINNVGVPDLLINDAGVAQPGLFQEQELKIFRWMMEVNYFGTLYVTKSVVPYMIQRGSGHIVNISSAAGFVGVYGYTAYGASKYAVRGFTDVLRAEMKQFGIKVSIAFPSDVDTPQLAYETEYKPQITAELSKTAKIVSADYVAYEVIKGILHEKYIITPGFDTSLLFHLSNLLGGWVYPVMDMQIR
jgi:3-dehydrosphinganine reductase